MIIRVTPRVGRVVALAIAGLVVALALYLLLSLFGGSAEQEEQIALLRRQAQTMAGLAAAAPQYEALAKRLSANGQIQSYAFSALQAQLAVAQLQTEVNQFIAQNGATVATSESLPGTQDRGLTKISVNATFDADIKSLVGVVHALEAARPLIFLQKLAIRDPDGEFATRPPAKPEVNKLRVEMTVIAYVRKT